MQIKTFLTKTGLANKRFSQFYGEFTNYEFAKTIGEFLNLHPLMQKGVFEAFFATWNLAIFVNSNGYDIYWLNSDKEDIAVLEFLAEQKIDGDYYFTRNWNEDFTKFWKEQPIQVYGETPELRYFYFTIKAIVETMGLINSLKVNN